jgi:hypothetical protein
MNLLIAGFRPRSLLVNFKLFILSCTLSFAVFFLYLSGYPYNPTEVLFPQNEVVAFETRPGTCPPRAYSNGKWTGPYYRTQDREMTNETQALAFAGFDSCASSREFWWHLAADNKDQWDRFPKAQSYRWTVGKEDGCDGFESSVNSRGELNKEQMVKDMVEQGGWLMLGDSITEGHFFSLSCSLYPHVIATPTYTPNTYFDRAWPQNLYLNPESPLVKNKEIYLPPHFNFTDTPLATFRRVDLLMTQKELEDLHDELYPPSTTYSKADPEPFKLFSGEAAWSLSPREDYLPIFFEKNYSTIVVSTAGHWTVTLFGGYGENKNWTVPTGAKEGVDGVIDFFGHAMRRWADQLQERIREKAQEERRAGLVPKNRQVVVRAYLPGHEDCHKARAPWRKILPMKWNWYNWGRIWQYNEVFEVCQFLLNR